MSVKKKVKPLTIGIVAVVVLIAIGVGANIGKTKVGSPTQTTSAPADPAKTTDTKKLIEIKTNTRKNCTSTPILVADKNGYFAAQGLKLVFTGELKDPEILPSVLNGSNDFADTHPNALATYVAGGATIKGVARSIIEPPASVDSKFRHMRYFVKKSTGIKTWNDLINYKKGKKLIYNGLAPSCVTFISSTIADRYKIGRDRIQFVNFDTDQAALQAVEQGNIDVAVVHPTFYKLAKDSGLQLIGDSSDSGLGEAAGIYLYYFTDAFIKDHPDTIKKFVKAINIAQNWANQHPAQAAKITGDYIGVAVDGSHYYSTTPVIPEDQIKPWVDDLVKNGKLKKGQVKISDMITHEFEKS